MGLYLKIKKNIAKGLRYITSPPALADCEIDKSARICSGSQITQCCVGRYSYLGHDCFAVNTRIGSFCSIADNCRIGGANHLYDRVSTSPIFQMGKNIMRVNFGNLDAPITLTTIIENDVWLGAGTLIKSGVHIGNGAIVGMGSVVTKDVPPYAIVAGNPAKIIKKRFDENTIIELLNLKWWDWNIEKICQNSQYFANPQSLLTYIKTSK